MTTNRMEGFLSELNRLYVELEGTYEGNQPKVLQKVEEARQLLSGDGDLGEGEKELLRMAERSGEANFLCLAVQNIIKATEATSRPKMSPTTTVDYESPSRALGTLQVPEPPTKEKLHPAQWRAFSLPWPGVPSAPMKGGRYAYLET